MIRFSPVFGLLALILSACDSEGIDRVTGQPADTVVSTTTGVTGGNSSTETNSETSATDTTSTDSNTDTTSDAQNNALNTAQNDDGSQSAENSQLSENAAQPVVVPPASDDAGQSTNADNSTDTTNTDVDNAGDNTTTTTDAGTADSTTSEDTDNNTVNMFGGSGSSDGGQNSQDATETTVSEESTETTDTDADGNSDSINMFGGSGSSDGGENGADTPEQTASSNDTADTTTNTDNSTTQDDDNPTTQDDGNSTTQDEGNSTLQNDGEDTSLSLEPPTSGTTFVSTTSPIHYGGPECSFPNKDENDNLIFNGNCPTIKRAGNVAFGDFLLANNTWNDCASAFANWTQCISVDDSSGKVKARWDYDWGNESDVRGAVWLVKSYPEVIYGVKSPGEYSAPTLAETVVATGLPAKVSNLPFYKISYSASSDEYPSRSKIYNGQTINGERNIAVESFFHELGGDCDVNTLVRNGTTSNQRFELMVWVDAGAERLPAAPNDYVTTTSIDGQQYDVYTKPSDREYIAFVAKNSRSSADLNWNSFIEWSREYSHRVNEVFGQGSNTVQIQDDWCLANILLGTEIWWGNGFFQLDDYSIQRTER